MIEEFKLPASSYEELVKIIKAYGQVNEPASIEEVSKLCGIHPSQISRNSGFLLGVGIIEGGKAKVATEKGKKLSRALVHEINEEISRIWQEIITENDFMAKMVAAIKIRKGMDIQSLQSHIAYSSGQNNNQYVRTGSAVIVELLKIAGLIEEVDGKIIAKNKEDNYSEDRNTEIVSQVNSCQKDNLVEKHFVRTEISSTNGVSINIDVKVHAKVDELDDLGKKLKKIILDISNLEKDSIKIDN